MSDALRGEAVPPSFSTSLGVAIPLAASILLAAALAVVHRFVVEPPEDSKRKRVPKRRHIIMAPTSWTDRRTLYSTPRAFECWLKMSRTSHGGVLIGSLGPWTTRAINVEVREGRPRIVWRARDFAYEWTVETDVRTEEWVHLVITFATNSALDMLLCFIDGAEVEDARPETALPTVVPELAMLVGRDHTDDPDQAFDGEIALVRLWSCVLPDEVIESHAAGTNRIYPALSEDVRNAAALEREERRIDADGLAYDAKHLIYHFHHTWPERAELARAPVSIDFWLCLSDASAGGTVCSSAPAAGSIVVQVLPKAARVRLTWHACSRASASADAEGAGGGMGVPMFDLTLAAAVPRGRWAHVALVYSRERDAILGFVDGQSAGEARRVAGMGLEPLALPQGPMCYAQDARPVGARGGGWFDGELSHVRFWASELRPAAIAAHAQGRAIRAAQLVKPNDARVAVDCRERRLVEQAQLAASADAEAEADAARRELEMAEQRRRHDEMLRVSKRQAAGAQVKVASFMVGKQVRFDDSFSQPAHVSRGWDVGSTEHGAANGAVLGALAALMEQFPAARLEIHVKVGSFGGGDLSRNRAVNNAAKALQLDPRTPKTVVEEIAKRRATATRDELVRLGMAEARLQLKWTALASASDVHFTPKPVSD